MRRPRSDASFHSLRETAPRARQSENILQPKLDLALRAGARVDGALDRAERRAGKTLHGQEEVRVIGYVKDLCAKLNALPLCDLKEARDPEIEIIQPGPAQNIAAGAAKCPRGILLPSWRLTRKAVAQSPIGQQRARIKPAVRSRVGQTPVTDNIGPVGILPCVALIGAG